MNTSKSVASCEVCTHADFVELWQKDGENYQRCVDCGLVRISPQPSDERLTKIYDEDYANIWGKEEQEKVFNNLKYKQNLRVLRPALRQLTSGGGG
jgi:Zn ribbon nucleic-acid-binding protein